MKLPGDPWNNRWSSFYGISWNFSMEIHGKCPNPPCKYFPWKYMEKYPWNSMEIDVLILRGIPWRIFHLIEVFHTGKFSYNTWQLF